MKDIRSKIIINLEINNLDLISTINILSEELSITVDELIMCSIEKLIYDIEYVRRLRN
ncbi:MAG: hypothetical protein E6Y83_01185 [Clostridium butyricum]|nr:hypothetical protein [Clostridium butyricum]